MKKAVFALAGAVLATPMVFAQAKNFEGLSLGATIANTKTTFDSAIGNSDGTTTGLDLQLQYGIPLSQQFVLGVGAMVGGTTNKAGNAAGLDLTMKSRSALELTPGFVVSDSLMVYGKVAVINATIDDGAGGTGSLSGMGYGLGVRGMVDKNVYWQVGYDSNAYGEKDLAGSLGKYTVKSTSLNLGVGYKF